MLTGVAPELLVADRHPATARAGGPLDHARRPARRSRCSTTTPTSPPTMAEHGLPDGEPVIGVAFDGTGYGDDGAVWGGEFLVADYRGFRPGRRTSRYVALPGGDAGVRNPYRMALSHLRARRPRRGTRGCRACAACRADELALLDRQLDDRLRLRADLQHGPALRRRRLARRRLPPGRYEAQAAMELEARPRGRSRTRSTAYRVRPRRRRRAASSTRRR